MPVNNSRSNRAKTFNLELPVDASPLTKALLKRRKKKKRAIQK